jgi:hypothetical protein
MAKMFLTMADLAARRGTDKEIGLVQQIVNWAPEISTVMGRTIAGTFATAKVQIGIPSGGAFRAVNGALLPSAGSYEKRRFNAFYFDAPLAVDEAELIAAEQEGDSLGDLQADETAGALQNKAILFSKQFYGLSGAGNTIVMPDPNGFPSLLNFLYMFNGGDGKGGVIDSRTGNTLVNYVDANPGSNNPAVDTIWYVMVHPQGVHFLFGGGQTIDVKPWVWQYRTPPGAAAGAQQRASMSNISGWIGIACAHPFAVGAILNVDATHQWTDKMSSQFHSLLPDGIKPTHCFCTKRAAAGLQQQRPVTLFGQGTGRPDQPTYAALPQIDIAGVPIITTDGPQLGAAISSAAL